MEEDDEEDATGLRIRQLRPKMDVVESMQRLYAVPSEKLRIWSVWLSQIGDEAEVWHRWLRAHIDLVLRMAELLKELEEKEKRPRRLKSETAQQVRRIFAYEEDAITDDGIEYPTGVKDFYDIEKILAKIVSDEGSMADENISEEGEEDGEEGEEDTLPEIGEETEGEEGEEGEEGKRMTGGADQSEEEQEESPEDAEADVEEADELGEEEEEEEDEADDYLKEWPLGTQWEPFEIEEEEPPEIIETLDMPTNMEELENMIKDFTATATIYRSYFKHWKETSDQAIKEIVGRSVLPTAKLRGVWQEGDLEASLRICLNYPKGPFRASDICLSPPGKIARLLALAGRIGEEDFIKEMARADEKIPYFFYRTAEQDIEIAIQHDDEEVILPDPEDEVITSKCGRLRFNLSDKPGMGRKCSVGNA